MKSSGTLNPEPSTREPSPPPAPPPVAPRVARPEPARRRPNPLRSLWQRAWVRWLVALAVIAGAGWGIQRYRAQQAAGKLPDGVQVANAERRTLEQEITATGVVAAQTGARVNIGAQLSGRIRELKADVGQVVKAGDLIAVLDLPEVENQVSQARDNVAQAERRLEQARINADLTREQTQTGILQSEAALESAKSRLESARAAADWQPEQTASDVERATAALASVNATKRQVLASVASQRHQAQTTVDGEKANRENIRRQLARARALATRGFTSQQDVDNLRTQLQQSEQRLQAAEENIVLVREKTDADQQAAIQAVSQAEANLRAARANTHQNRLRTADAESARHAVNQAEAQLAQAQANRKQVEAREKAVREAESALKVTKSQLDTQLVQQGRTEIRSPISGTVVSIAAQQGETVAAAFAAPTLIVVTDLSRLEVKAYVDENDIGQVRLGLPATIEVDSHPDRRFQGRVTKIASASTVKDNVVTYETIIALDNPGGLLKPDMTAKVQIDLARRSDVLAVPIEAIKMEGQQSVVYLLPPGAAKPEKRTVKTGLSDDSYTEVTSGLKPGERVVLSGLDRFGLTGFATRR